VERRAGKREFLADAAAATTAEAAAAAATAPVKNQ